MNFYDTNFTFIDDAGNIIKVKRIPRMITIREILAFQMEISIWKGCKVFVVYVMDDKDNDN